MTLMIDAAPLVAFMDRRDPMQPEVARLLHSETGELVLPAQVSAEVDYMARRRLGRAAATAFLRDLAGARFRVACLEEPEYETLLSTDRKYSDLDVGLADLSIVVLARRFRTQRVLTFDLRHFRALRPLDGGRFQLLPADGQD